MNNEEVNKNIKSELKNSFIFSIMMPTTFMIFAWLIFIVEKGLDLDFSIYGLYPRDIKHWYGIFTMPFLHADIKHIFLNSISFIGLGTLLFYFYPKYAWKVFGISFLMCGILTWIIGRSNYHIGASALIYAFASYIFTTGIKSRNRKLLAVALIVIIVNGGMIWGVLPQNTSISWEGHLSGFISGIVLAFIFVPPQEKTVINHATEQLYTKFSYNDYNSTENSDVEINYFYKNEHKKIAK